MSRLQGNESTHCSPSRYCTHKQTGSCLIATEMIKILLAHGVVVKTSHSAKQLATMLKALVRNSGSTEQALVEPSHPAYRPMAPASWKLSRTSEWLSSDDIEKVMRQYEIARKDFMFIAVCPINFLERPLVYGGRCVSPAMCALDIGTVLKAGVVKHLGVVLNMDRHDLGGSHWVSIYIGLEKKSPMFGVFYYDSVAKPPSKQVLLWMKGIAQAVQHGQDRMKFQIGSNRIRRQFGQSECGIFAMMFLIHALQAKLSFQSLCETLGKDDVMKSLRKVLFRPQEQLRQAR